MNYITELNNVIIRYNINNNMSRQFTHIEVEEQEQADAGEYRNQSMSSRHKLLYAVLIIALIGSTALNLLTSDPEIASYEDFTTSNTVHQKKYNREEQQQKLIERLQSEHNSSKYNFPLSDKVKERISYGQPRPKSHSIKALIIKKKQAISDAKQCLFTNGITIISSKTTTTAKNILAQSEVSQWILFLSAIDAVADDLIKKLLADIGGGYEMKTFPLVIDSDYSFISTFTSSCETIIYMQNNFIVDAEQAKNFVAAAKKLQDQKKQGYMGFTTNAKVGTEVKRLQDLPSINLYELKQEKFNQFVYIFDVKFFSLITPINFIHFNKYTIEQLIINPILLITQRSQNLIPITTSMHTFDESVVQFKQFDLKQPKSVGSSKQFCFVSYPSTPNEVSIQQFTNYVNSIQKIQAEGHSVSLIAYTPYNSKEEDSLYNAYKVLSKLKNNNSKLRIKLRIKQFKAVSSLAAYQSARVYCPEQSIMITSRFNVNFDKGFLTRLSTVISEKFHYYYSSNINFKNEAVIKQNLVTGQQERFQLQSYITHLSQVQISKVSLMNMIHLWALKVQQNQFFETQASFVLPMLEMTGYSIQGIPLAYKMNPTRRPSQQQYKELRHLNNYGKWDKISDNLLKPIKFNSLTNLDLRRGALDSIPKIIHQIWFKDESIPDKVKKLQKTVQQINKGFQYMLWKKQNLTYHDFPMSYPLIARTLQYEWASGKSYHPWVQALLSYEVLYNHGGIYLALNAEAVKPLDSFLKYELLFAGFYTPQGSYGSPVSVGREVIGSKRYGYHVRMVLTEIITVQRMNFQLLDYEAMIGGDALRISMTDNELFTTVAFGFYLFTYDSYKSSNSICDDIKTPCVSHDESYIILRDLY